MILIVFALLIATGLIWFNTAAPFGSKIKGSYKTQLANSANHNGKTFINQEETAIKKEGVSYFTVLKEFSSGTQNGAPTNAIKNVEFDTKKFNALDSKLHVTWFGHSTLLMKINGTTILTDPVFSKRTSPVKWTGTKQFDFENDFSVEVLPKIDILLISHDHYDHLDYKVIKQLHTKVKSIVVPLGVKAHLQKWNIDNNKITELDWWESATINTTQIVCAPARHFSGRRGSDQFHSLWCSFVIKNDDESVFFSGDSGYGKHFKEIGEKYGPFNLTAMECGQYNKYWPEIHMFPEETHRAHLDVKGEYLLPIHWGKFKLSLHSWTDPVDRLNAAAQEIGTKVLLPQPGDIVSATEFGKTGVKWYEI